MPKVQRLVDEQCDAGQRLVSKTLSRDCDRVFAGWDNWRAEVACLVRRGVPGGAICDQCQLDSGIRYYCS